MKLTCRRDVNMNVAGERGSLRSYVTTSTIKRQKLTDVSRDTRGNLHNEPGLSEGRRAWPP